MPQSAQVLYCCVAKIINIIFEKLLKDALQLKVISKHTTIDLKIDNSVSPKPEHFLLQRISKVFQCNQDVLPTTNVNYILTPEKRLFYKLLLYFEKFCPDSIFFCCLQFDCIFLFLSIFFRSFIFSIFLLSFFEFSTKL